mmetsp:Transcript_30914/g.76881  ORF Transcript_30914/g.76881 Transcript_30914/m.76881 type:complete len:254 (-) Transcript_30914:308-1069(-)|eukprot:CAMPEP_0197609354 /NCGR_PEP_ID=MMETSP1326-20131121/51033_1 /TAXON_ID=1155430 /ORGANISM="Genus nov. species nov., Strain RCC2288" /LENGTH=253 /DNA_ID=CAMNT_0043177713 /DNA_START=49 /DNA_END=810 /DNA_ORIENTATION=+
MGLVADYGSEDSDNEEECADAGGKVELLSNEEPKGAKRALEPQTPDVSQYYAYGGGWYDKAGNYCWVTADGRLHTLRPGASAPIVTGGNGAAAVAANGGGKRARGAGVGGGGKEEEKMEFPQHKLPILNAAAMKDVMTKTGARLRVQEGRVKTGSVKKGVQATIFLTGTAAAIQAAKDDIGARLTANAASAEMVKDGKYKFKKKSQYVDGFVNGEKPRVNPYHDWRHSGMGWDNGGLTGTDGATGAHCTWKKS